MHDPNIEPSDRPLRFGRFLLHAKRRVLLEGERPLRLSSRALDILLVLVERPGTIVSKEEIIARVWAGAVVEEINLRVHIAALRRALGEGHSGERYITNVPLRGYAFVGYVEPDVDIPAEPPVPAGRSGNLPALLVPLEGREHLSGMLQSQLQGARLVTLVGPGGIGKTSLALAAAAHVEEHFRDGVWFVDLSVVDRAEDIPRRVAQTLGMIPDKTPPAALEKHLQERRLLLLLDNCEHLITSCAAWVEQWLARCPGLTILATSREPLCVSGEHSHRLPPLPVTSTEPGGGAGAAIRLFMHRARQVLPDLELDADGQRTVVDICHRLAGLPLAIEIAAQQLETIDLPHLELLVQEMPERLINPRRHAPQRHRTLRDTWSWSLGLLSPLEMNCLAQFAAVSGGFGLEAAREVIAAPTCCADCSTAIVQALLRKSLLEADRRDGSLRYRLPASLRRHLQRRTVPVLQTPPVVISRRLLPA